ncbi:MAG: dolichyl-phosphate beta-glucosyltransferase [Gemmatimonadota bacterium]|nr:dolichyl-phosphate beta-glucosyltransferase [Gemmatimonadota bacterium]
MTKPPVDLSVIVPVYNEENRIGVSLIKILTYLDSLHLNYEVVIVDDGSPDNTLSVIEEIRRNNPVISVYKYNQNRGKGYAVRYGLQKGRGKVRLFTDADLSTPIEELERFLKWMDEGYDVCIASRAVPESNITLHQTMHREMLGKIFNKIIRLFLFLPFSDTQCGFKCFTGAFVDQMMPLMTVNRFGFDSELLFVANKSGYSIKELGTQWENSPETKVSLFADPIKMLGAIPKIYYNLLSGHYNLE